MEFIEDIKEIRRELSYAVAHDKDGHRVTVLAIMLQVRLLVERTLKHISERSQANGQERTDSTTNKAGQTQA